MRVYGVVFLDDGFEAAGAVRLAGASIERQLSMGGAKLTGTDPVGNALFAEGMRVTGGVVLDEGFEAAGAVRLLGASIEGQLSMRGAKLTGTDPDGDALVADGMRVTGEVFLDGGFEVAGTVRLTDAECGVLFPGAVGPLVLGGIRLGAVPMLGWQEQLSWIRRQGWDDWSPDPYEQVAGAYLRGGDEEAARQIRIARHDDELRHLREVQRAGTRRYRFWRRALGVTVGYGYRRYRAGWALVATIVAAVGMFGWAEDQGAMVPADPPEDAQQCGPDYPCFNPMVYGADVVLPIIDFGQDTAWRPIEVNTTTRVAGLDPGGWWVTARWVFIALGWILASVFVAAFTSIVQRP
jgi:hypothetical protein